MLRSCIVFVLMTNGAQSLGFPADSKLLIVHADDMGMCPSVNRATIAALEAGAVTSASVMVPCRGFAHAAEWSALHPAHDVGIHSTLISEWKDYRWGPISKKARSPGLMDEDGYFWSRNSLLHASSQEIEEEISAQIMRAKEAGVDPSHLDSHMLSVARSDYITPYIKTARKFALPFLIDEYWHSRASLQDPKSVNDIVVNSLFQAISELSIDSLEDYYISTLRALKPGLSQLIVHPGFDDDELRSITGNARAYGAAWRQRDFEIVMSDRFSSALRENGIQLVNWRMIKSAIGGKSNAWADGDRSSG